MNKNIKRQHSAEFKTTVVLALLKQEETINQICSRYGIHPTQARRWKEQALANLTSSFEGNSIIQQLKAKQDLVDELYREVGQLKVELDWLKKKMGLTS